MVVTFPIFNQVNQNEKSIADIHLLFSIRAVQVDLTYATTGQNPRLFMSLPDTTFVLKSMTRNRFRKIFSGP